MTKRMLIDAMHAEETRVVIADETQIYDFDFVSTAKKQLKGNIYLAKVTRVEPSLQAAFVEYGGGKQGFLPFAEIHTDYYQIPVADRKKLMEEMEREAEKTNEEKATEENLEHTTSEDNSQIEGDTTVISEETNNEDPQNNELINNDEERPAYLLQGAIDISISEELPNIESGETDTSEPEALIQGETEQAQPTPLETDSSTDTPPLPETDKEEVETLASDEEELRDKRKRNNFLRRYKIQEVIRRGQVVLIQVIKEERGNKGVSLTTYLSLAGRYCVLMPNSPKDGGISRKIASAEDRKRLKAISTEFRLAEGMSVIIRTAGMDRTHAEIKRDFDYLVKLWNAIREDTLKSNAPALIYEESDIVKRAIRDQYSNDIEEILIEGENAFRSARDFMKMLLPSHLPKIKTYSAQTPLFYAYNVEDQLLSMHDPVVKMKSGAYLVINPTEALISIDVNSGKATGERNIEETALKTNIEAAQEVARQLRLRDLAGLVVIDFIDMLDSRNRRTVEKTLKDAMKNDRAKIQLGRISPFGLLEMSRQRLRPSVSETNMTPCPHCIGRGVIRSNESMSIQVIRSIEKEASNGNSGGLRVLCTQNLAMYMLNSKRDVLREMESRHNISIQILINPELALSDFTIEKQRRDRNEKNDNNERRPKWNDRAERNDRQRNNNNNNQNNSSSEPKEIVAEEVVVENADGEASSDAATGDNAERNARRRRRGRRGGRNRDRDRDNNSPNEQSGDNVIQMIPPENMDTETTSDKPQATENEGNTTQTRNRGRGRRDWREKEPKNDNRSASNDSNDIPTSWKSGAAEMGDGKSLPAFASDLRPVAVPAPPTYKPFHDYKPESKPAEQEAQSAAPASPPKRGWWQKMISLDD